MEVNVVGQYYFPGMYNRSWDSSGGNHWPFLSTQGGSVRLRAIRNNSKSVIKRGKNGSNAARDDEDFTRMKKYFEITQGSEETCHLVGRVDMTLCIITDANHPHTVCTRLSLHVQQSKLGAFHCSLTHSMLIECLGYFKTSKLFWPA